MAHNYTQRLRRVLISGSAVLVFLAFAPAARAADVTEVTTASVEAAPASEATTDSTAPAEITTGALLEPLPRGEVTGFTQTKFRARRFRPLPNDRDLYQYLNMNFGEEDEEVSGTFYVRANTLLTGVQAPSSALRDLDDTFGDPSARLYYGYVNVRDTGFVERLRAGRQSIDEVPGVFFDGVRADDSLDKRTRVSIYGGRAVHFYERGQGDDWVLGAGFERLVNDDLRLRLDVAHVEDEMDPQGGPALPFLPLARDESDTMVSLNAFWHAHEHLDVDGRVTRINGDYRSVRGAANFRYPGQRLYFTASAEVQPDPFLGMTTEFSPYFDLLGGYAGYKQFGLQGTKGIGEDIDLSFGYFGHNSDSDTGVNAFNQDFDRYFLGFFFPTLFDAEKLSLSVNFDRYTADINDFYTVGGELGYAASARSRFALGSSYSMYEFDPLTGFLRDHVREYYVAGDWKALRDWRIRSRFIVEPFQDGGTFRTLELSVRHDF